MTGPFLWIIAALGLASAIGFSPVAAQGNADPKRTGQDARRCGGTLVENKLTTIGAEGDFALSDGQPAKLSGLRLPETDLHRRQAVELLRVQREKSVIVESLGEKDRWGRLPVRIRLSSAETGSDLSHILVEAGLAIVDPGPERVFCQPELLAFEERPVNSALVFGPMPAITPFLPSKTSFCGSVSAASSSSKDGCGAWASASRQPI
ncbi:hypothetical protein [Microvirga sp. P5_D2]